MNYLVDTDVLAKTVRVSVRLPRTVPVQKLMGHADTKHTAHDLAALLASKRETMVAMLVELCCLGLHTTNRGHHQKVSKVGGF